MAMTNASRSPASGNSWSSCSRPRSRLREQSKKPVNTFQDRRVWITGASSGIGEALAVAFHHAGARKESTGRREDELKRVQARCGGEPRTKVLPIDMSLAAELPAKAGFARAMF